MPGFVFAVSVTAADSSWCAHAHLTLLPVSVWGGTGRNGRAEGRSNAEISTRLVLQLMKCHVCVVLITAPTSQTWELLLTRSRCWRGTPRTPKPLIRSPEGHYLCCRWLGYKCHKVTTVFIRCFRCEWTTVGMSKISQTITHMQQQNLFLHVMACECWCSAVLVYHNVPCWPFVIFF